MRIKTKNAPKELTVFLVGGIVCLAIAIYLPFFAVGAIAFETRAFLLTFDPAVKKESYGIRQRYLAGLIALFSVWLLFAQ